MKTAIIILKKELVSWKEHYESEKIYFAGEELDKNAIRSFAECTKYIFDLTKATFIGDDEKHQSSCWIATVLVEKRADLKAKLAKELSYHQTNLSRYHDLPDIDANKLKQLTQQLEETSRSWRISSKVGGYPLLEM